MDPERICLRTKPIHQILFGGPLLGRGPYGGSHLVQRIRRERPLAQRRRPQRKPGVHHPAKDPVPVRSRFPPSLRPKPPARRAELVEKRLRRLAADFRKEVWGLHLWWICPRRTPPQGAESLKLRPPPGRARAIRLGRLSWGRPRARSWRSRTALLSPGTAWLLSGPICKCFVNKQARQPTESKPLNASECCWNLRPSQRSQGAGASWLRDALSFFPPVAFNAVA